MLEPPRRLDPLSANHGRQQPPATGRVSRNNRTFIMTTRKKSLVFGIKAVHPDAIVPSMYETHGAACADLQVVGLDASITIHPGETKIFRTGLAFEMPAEYVMYLSTPSGLGFKDGLCLAPGAGLFPWEYRGEIRLNLSCSLHGQAITIANGDKVARAMIVPLAQARLKNGVILSARSLDSTSQKRRHG